MLRAGVEKWVASDRPGEIMHAATYRVVMPLVEDEDEVCVCWADSHEFARQIAHEHNTHAALVEALGHCRDAIIQLSQVLGKGTIATEAIERADAALADAKGGAA